jgi:hypothetical protein
MCNTTTQPKKTERNERKENLDLSVCDGTEAKEKYRERFLNFMPVGRNRRRKRNGKKGRNVVALHVCLFPSSIFSSCGLERRR